jgi:hypothetical protein
MHADLDQNIKGRKTMKLRLGLICLLAAVPVLAAADGLSSLHANHFGSPWKKGSPLVEKVRRATERYRDINVAIAEKWVQATPCVSGPNEGAMGVHWVKGERLNDLVLDPEQPEALIYEPLGNNRWRLVGIEFIQFAEAWDAQKIGPPALDGHLMNLIGAPNRYGLDPFYELHVWSWEPNPNGNFADWNTAVTCDRQAGLN